MRMPKSAIFIVWIVGGFLLMVVAPSSFQSSYCLSARNDVAYQSLCNPEDPECIVRRTEGDLTKAGSGGERDHFDSLISSLLCGEGKFTDWLLVFFTYSLVVVGYFQMHGNEETLRNMERAFVFIGHDRPNLVSHRVVVSIRAVNRGRMPAIIKEVRWHFVHNLPRKPRAAREWSWHVDTHDYVLAPDKPWELGRAVSQIPGQQACAICITYQDMFTKRMLKSWATMEIFEEEGGMLGTRRAGGDLWNSWD